MSSPVSPCGRGGGGGGWVLELLVVPEGCELLPQGAPRSTIDGTANGGLGGAMEDARPRRFAGARDAGNEGME